MDVLLKLTDGEPLGSLEQEVREAALPEGIWCVAEKADDGLAFRFQAGSLVGGIFLTADLLLEGTVLGVFAVTLQEGENGPAFHYRFGLLNECSARLRMPLSAVDQNVWTFPREGALLKPICSGDRVDLAKVDRMMFRVLRKGPEKAKWCITPFLVTKDEPALLQSPVLPRGLLLDELGQSTLHDWPNKTRYVDEATARLKVQLFESEKAKRPAGLSKWGGWTAQQWEATGYFRTHHDGRRWWLVDPDGHPFWSAGMDCFRMGIPTQADGLEAAMPSIPEIEASRSGRMEPGSVDFLRANFHRAFGAGRARTAWNSIALGLMKRWGFNTVGNWSDWEVARAAGFPYVRPLEPQWKVPTIFRDFPDIHHPGYEADLKRYATQLRETRNDPALIGYFLMNEPTWGFAAQTPAEGMWHNAPDSATRAVFVEWLHARHGGEPVQEDFAAFSSIMAAKLFADLSAACKAVDPHHLNLGARYYTIPPEWAIEGMRTFDVFSLNCYKEQLNPEWVERIVSLLGRPVMVGEWHFGALDAGLPATGIGSVPDQKSRGEAFRFYTEQAAALPGCVGVHWFTLYDQSALGRFDGENYNIGFLDVCNRPYEALVSAAAEAHRNLYAIAAGERAPTAHRPEYLPLIFI